MAEHKCLQFDGLKRPVALENAAAIENLVSTIMPAWPHRSVRASQDEPSFVSIRPADKRRWEFVCAEPHGPPRVWDDVNTVCDLISEIAWERLRSDPGLLCLHAAAVDFGGRLVVFPNARRAGKSTLAIALARLGLPLFTDDFLPVRVNAASGTCGGLANGVVPRLRLPVPKGFSDAFRRWVARDKGPSNRQYKYLTDVTLAPWGVALPLGAMVVLDRQDMPTDPQLSPIAREDALTSLITQNFARTRHAGALLRSIDILSRSLPIYRLRYHSAEVAADYLAAHPDLRSLPAAQIADLAPDERDAPLWQEAVPGAPFFPDKRYTQAQAVTETIAGDDCFLADKAGISILRLNAMSAAIWKVLEEPTNLTELVQLVAAAFPDVATDRIAADCERLMRDLVDARLIAPAPLDAAAE